MLELYTDADGKLKERECEEPKQSKPKRKDIIIAYIRMFYDPDDEIAVNANYAMVTAGLAVPPPADIVEKYTKEHNDYQKVRKQAKAYAKEILGSSE